MREEINRIEEDETEKNLRELCIKVKRCCRKHDYIAVAQSYLLKKG